MSYSLNRVTLVGNLGGDPEQKFTGAGMSVATFNLATTDSKKNDDGTYENFTEWHRIAAFGKFSEWLVSNLRKGMRVYVEGRLKTRAYDSNGQRHYFTEVIASSCIPMSETSGTANAKESTAPAEASIPEDDLPF